MPLTQEQQDALAALFTGTLKEADDADVVTGLKAAAGHIHNSILNEGVSKGQGQTPKEMRKLTKRLEEAQSRIKQLEDEREHPTDDIEKIRKEADDEIKKVRLEMKQLEERTAQEKTEAAINRVLDQFGEILAREGDGNGGKVRSGWVRLLKADPEMRKRIKVDEDGDITILQEGKKIGIAADDDTLPAMLKALASETVTRLKKEDPEAIKVEMDDGAGVENTGTASGGEQGYDPVKEGKRMAEEQKSARDRDKGLAFR